MGASWNRIGLLTAAVALLSGGCVSSIQLADFARTEVARISADIVGQLYTLLVQAAT